jgi:hypothetical protein
MLSTLKSDFGWGLVPAAAADFEGAAVDFDGEATELASLALPTVSSARADWAESTKHKDVSNPATL